MLKIIGDTGNVVERKRCTTVNHAMKSCRRAWFICARRNPRKVVDGTIPLINPFAKMGLESSDRETATATYLGTDYVPHQGEGVSPDRVGWLQRETDIFATFDVTYYRSKERSNMVREIDAKTSSESGFPCSMMPAHRSIPK